MRNNEIIKFFKLINEDATKSNDLSPNPKLSLMPGLGVELSVPRALPAALPRKPPFINLLRHGADVPGAAFSLRSDKQALHLP